MKFFIKLLLLGLIVTFALFNHKYISFDKGISKTDFEDKSVIGVLTTVTGVKSVQYYKKTFAREDGYNYKVYIVTTGDAYLLDATDDDIKAFKTLGIFSSKFQPEKISPIPFYVEVIVGFLVLVIPFGKKSSHNRPAEHQQPQTDSAQ